MKKRVQFIAYVLFMCLFIGWLIFSNSIVASFIGAASMKEFNSDLDNLKKDTPLWYVDHMAPMNDIFERIFVRGWAFVETKQPNLERRISMFLQNSDSCYSVDFQDSMVKRTDVLSVHPQAGSDAVGFSGEFTLLGMKDGMYKLYLYVWENDVNYGLIIMYP